MIRTTRKSGRLGALWRSCWLAMPVLAAPLHGWAKDCEGGGHLRYLGVSSDGGRSVWLSATSPGQFALESAKGGQVDQWQKQRRGLRISTSPEVSNGNGGTHKLYATDGNKPCLLDTQNQKGGFVFPPALPSFPPIGLLPPVTGLMPGLPSKPKLPGAVMPPIGALPPVTGLTPTLPGAVTPPIGTLPPVTGLTPTLPGAVTPPIGTLPPVTGLTPTLPGAVTPPIGTLPPVTGLTPTLPGAVTPPIGHVVQPDAATRLATAAGVPCRGGRPTSPLPGGSTDLLAADCVEPAPMVITTPAPGAIVSLTEGRERVVESLWNVWIDLHRIGAEDRRNGLDLDTRTGGATVGLDRRIGADAVAGLSLSLDRSDSRAFDGAMTSQATGFLIGPYVAYRLSDRWAADAAFALGGYEADRQLDVLQGSYQARRYTLAFNANGQYEVDQTLVRPRLSVYYAQVHNDGYLMTGNVAGQSVSLAMSKANSSYGMVEASNELTQPFRFSGGSVIAPYARLAVRYETARESDGDILASDLTRVSTSPWGGSLRIGARALVDPATMVEAEAGYLSLGQSGLRVWALKLYVAHAF